MVAVVKRWIQDRRNKKRFEALKREVEKIRVSMLKTSSKNPDKTHTATLDIVR